MCDCLCVYVSVVKRPLKMNSPLALKGRERYAEMINEIYMYARVCVCVSLYAVKHEHVR